MNDNSYTELISKKTLKEQSCIGVEIDGFLFIADEISFDNSYADREYKRTPIMNGGEFVSRTTYNPKELSFKSSFDIEPSNPDFYDVVFGYMENKKGGCEILSPYCGLFQGEVDIEKTYPTGSPNELEVEVKIKEIPKPNQVCVGDTIITYPSVTKISDKAVTISNEKDNSTTTKSSTDEWKQKLIVEYDNPYNKEGYTNVF